MSTPRELFAVASVDRGGEHSSALHRRPGRQAVPGAEACERLATARSGCELDGAPEEGCLGGMNAGGKLGPYEIHAPLGEVYRGRDGKAS